MIEDQNIQPHAVEHRDGIKPVSHVAAITVQIQHGPARTGRRHVPGIQGFAVCGSQFQGLVDQARIRRRGIERP
jgi:hypothetical protein